MQLTRALAAEWATRGAGERHRARRSRPGQMIEGASSGEPEFYAAFKQKHAMNRFGAADELAGPGPSAGV